MGMLPIPTFFVDPISETQYIFRLTKSSSRSKKAGLKYNFLRVLAAAMALTVSGRSSRPSGVSTMDTFSSGNLSMALES